MPSKGRTFVKPQNQYITFARSATHCKQTKANMAQAVSPMKTTDADGVATPRDKDLTTPPKKSGPCPLLQVRRPDVRRGRALELLVRWADDRGMAWSDSWISIAMVSRDLRDQAREMEKAIYPQVARQATGARADRRQNSAKRQAHERAQQQWAARLRDRGRKRTRTESDGSV